MSSKRVKRATPWQKLCAQVRRDYPHIKGKDVFKKASTLYKKKGKGVTYDPSSNRDVVALRSSFETEDLIPDLEEPNIDDLDEEPEVVRDIDYIEWEAVTPDFRFIRLRDEDGRWQGFQFNREDARTIRDLHTSLENARNTGDVPNTMRYFLQLQDILSDIRLQGGILGDEENLNPQLPMGEHLRLAQEREELEEARQREEEARQRALRNAMQEALFHDSDSSEDDEVRDARRARTRFVAGENSDIDIDSSSESSEEEEYF